MKKYLAECIGTATLVILGCGTAMLVGCDAAAGSGYLLTALAFGLTIVAMAYSIGNISGCHINPAVSLGVLLSGGMEAKEFVGYVISQCIGALAGAGIL
ncbi:MAG: aquaporin, partial [Clostridia bacterium]|nr:aquaporin [Clostridia bacterium]